MVGVFLIILGFMIWSGGVKAFRDFGKGTPYPGRPPQNLVTGGPYKYIRNPIFLGFFLIILGVGVVLDLTLLSLYSFLPLLLLHLNVVYREEPDSKTNLVKLTVNTRDEYHVGFRDYSAWRGTVTPRELDSWERFEPVKL